MDLDAEEVMSIVKIIYLDAEVSVKKTMVALVFEIEGGNIYMTITLMNQDITVLLQIIALGSKIQCLGTIVFSLILCLVDVITKDEYLWMLYQKFWQLC